MTEKLNDPMKENNKNEPVGSWRKALLGEDVTIQQVISNLSESAFQISLIVSQEGTLLGTVTDGDIRRGLLRDLNIDSSVNEIISKDPLVVPPECDKHTALRLMQVNQIHQLPIVDENRRVVGLHRWNELISPNKRSNLMVIMAGGQGTRLRPQTENCPKPLLPVGGKPILEHIIGRAKSEGFQRFVLAIQYLGHMIEEYFGDGSSLDVEIEYLREKTPLGTAGALGFINPRPDSPFVVSNGDVLTDIQYGELLDFHGTHNATATMAVRTHELHHPFGVVYTDGVDISGFEEKPIVRNHINAGVYVLDPSVLDMLEPGKCCDMPTLFNRLLDKDMRTIVYPMHEPWLDVGQKDDLKQAQANHLKKT
jgi:dTDP-glucose pyrophosphorylase